MAKGKSGAKGGGLPALDKSPSHLLHRALQLALDIYADEFGLGGLTQRQYAVLAAVESKDDLTQTDLVRITGIDRSTLADMAARMIAKGLLERKRSTSDARANAVNLTDAGRDALAEAGPKMARADGRLLKLLSGNKRDGLTSILRDLVKAGDEVQSAADKAPKKATADKLKVDKPKKTKAGKAAKAAAKPDKKKAKKVA